MSQWLLACSLPRQMDQFKRMTITESLQQWCRRRGCKRTPKSFDLVKTFAKTLKISANSLKIRANWRPRALIRKNSAQNHMKTFVFRGHPKYGLHEKIFVHEVAQDFSGKFGEVRAKLLIAPPKFACSCTYALQRCLSIPDRS